MGDFGFVADVGAFSETTEDQNRGSRGPEGEGYQVAGIPDARTVIPETTSGGLVVSAGPFFDGTEPAKDASESPDHRPNTRAGLPPGPTRGDFNNPEINRSFYGPKGFDLKAYDSCLPPAVGRLFEYGDGYTATPIAANIIKTTKSMQVNLILSVCGLLVGGAVAGVSICFGAPIISLFAGVLGGGASMFGVVVNFFHKQQMESDVPTGINELFNLFAKRGCPENKARYLGRLIDLLQSLPLFAGSESINIFGNHPASQRNNLVRQVSVAANEVIADVWLAHDKGKKSGAANESQVLIEAAERNMEERVNNQLTPDLFKKLTENVMTQPNLLWDLSLRTAGGGLGLIFVTVLASGLL